MPRTLRIIDDSNVCVELEISDVGSLLSGVTGKKSKKALP